MNIAESLDSLRARHPGCVLAAFGDLGTRLILRTSSDTPYPQEFLDQIGLQAAQNFELHDRFFAGTAGAADEDIGDIVVLTPEDTRLIVRSDSNPSDFLCCVCKPNQPIDDIAMAAAAVLRDISEAP